MLPDLSVVSHLNAGTVIVDGAAVLILVGMIIHTSLYRSRGRLDDKLFFAMLITDLVAAVCDGCNYLLENGTDPLAARLIMIGIPSFPRHLFCSVSCLPCSYITARIMTASGSGKTGFTTRCPRFSRLP